MEAECESENEAQKGIKFRLFEPGVSKVWPLVWIQISNNLKTPFLYQ